MKLFENYEDFKNFVGLLEEDTDWKTIGIEPSEGPYFTVDRLPELLAFIEKNPEYHIVTWTSDGDDNNRNTYDNCMRWVNRIEYLLANGSKEPAFLQEDRQ